MSRIRDTRLISANLLMTASEGHIPILDEIVVAKIRQKKSLVP